MFYSLRADLQEVKAEEIDDWQDLAAVLTEDEVRTLAERGLWMPGQLPDMKSIRFCRVVTVAKRLAGTIYRPCLTGDGQQRIAFVFVLWDNNLLLIDDLGHCQTVLAHLQKQPSRAPFSAGRVFGDILEDMLGDDLAYLSELEERAALLERQVFSDGGWDDFDQEMMGFRKDVAALANFYLQLADLAEALEGDTEDHFSAEEERRLQILGERVSRLREEALMLREYAMQIREVYQAQIGIRQNEIMKVLTVVTSIFLPLSLIAGWYGMNFTYMPELAWRYSYPAVIAVSVVVAVGCLVYFKHKRFW